MSLPGPDRCFLLVVGLLLAGLAGAAPSRDYAGTYFSGSGSPSYIRLLDTCAQMLYPNPELQNLGMLYNSSWNGFVEGPTWGAWWIQNSYGPSYCGMPFFQEPYSSFLRNAQDLWFSQMGDGQRVGGGDWKWVAPDGCLCDAAAPGWIYYKQGDGNIAIHDWGMEFTAAGIVMQAELLLVNRDPKLLAHYLPLVERSANFIETRRDPQNNLFLAGPAGNLLAPSYAGYRKPDGTYDKAYLAGLSITYIAALDRLIELEKLAGQADKASLYARRRDLARQGLPLLTTPDGYFIKSLDPDGTKHGVYGAAKHGYFEAVCNHDAIALRVVDDQQAQRIYKKLASIPELRPHDVIITNAPSLDDMYVEPRGLWQFGTWVNGGHWTTCEARMILAYFRLGKYEDARRSMNQLMKFFRPFRADNPLVEFGNAPYQPKEPINCVYDNWGGPLGMLRGLFEYLYTADSLRLIPHIPTGITRLEQKLPVRFGTKQVYLTTCGAGPVTAAYLNGKPWRKLDRESVTLTYADLPTVARVTICLGGAKPQPAVVAAPPAPVAPGPDDPLWQVNTWWSNPLGNGHPLRIGADSRGSCLFVGDMRRVRVYRRELTAAEVATLATAPTAALPPDKALVADLPFDQVRDDRCPNLADAAYVPQVKGEVQFTAGDGGPVARFGGKGWLELPADARVTLTDTYSLEAWVKPGAIPAGGIRLLDRVTAGVDDGYLLDLWPGYSLRFISERGHLSAGGGLRPDGWLHVVATFSDAGGMRLYANGKLTGQTPLVAPPAATGLAQMGALYNGLRAAGLGESYEARHAWLIVWHLQALRERLALEQEGKLPALAPVSQRAADASYLEAAKRLEEGLRRVLRSYEKSEDPHQRQVWEVWRKVTGAAK